MHVFVCLRPTQRVSLGSLIRVSSCHNPLSPAFRQPESGVHAPPVFQAHSGSQPVIGHMASGTADQFASACTTKTGPPVLWALLT